MTHKTITLEVKDGRTSFSIEQDGVTRSASFSEDGYSSYVEGSSGSGGLGMSNSVRKLAQEARRDLHAWADLLELP